MNPEAYLRRPTRSFSATRFAGTRLVTNIVSNGGVEIGQFLALTGVLLALGYWRTRPGFLRHAHVTNAGLMTAGFVLAGYQMTGYFMAAR